MFVRSFAASSRSAHAATQGDAADATWGSSHGGRSESASASASATGAAASSARRLLSVLAADAVSAPTPRAASSASSASSLRTSQMTSHISPHISSPRRHQKSASPALARAAPELGELCCPLPARGAAAFAWGCPLGLLGII